MAQANGNVANGSGAAVRQDLNNQLEAVFSTSSGDTAPSTTYPCQLWADTNNDEIKIRNKANSAFTTLRGLDGSFTVPDGSASTPAIRFTSAASTGLYRPTANIIGISTGGTQRLEIGRDLGGNAGDISLLWKTTTTPISTNSSSSEGMQVTQRGKVHIGQSDRVCLVLNRMATPDGKIINFQQQGVDCGSVNRVNGGTAYNTSSDYRLKENVVDLVGAKSRLNDLKVKRFNLISFPSATVDGFLAHEVQTIVPEAITGTKDQVDSDGNPEYQGIDQSKLVPLLTAALQEAFAEIAALTARVETLEAG